MVDATLLLSGLSPIEGKEIVARFDGGRLSSDGGLLVLREIEQRSAFIENLARVEPERVTVGDLNRSLIEFQRRFPDERGVRGVFGSGALAGRVPLPIMRARKGLGLGSYKSAWLLCDTLRPCNGRPRPLAARRSGGAR